MKQILLATTAIFALTGFAYGQTYNADAPNGTAFVKETNDTSEGVSVGTEKASAIVDNLNPQGGGNSTNSEATVEKGLVGSTFGDAVGQPNDGSADITTTVAGNSNAQFQLGNSNSATNLQDGSDQVSVTLQNGEDNVALNSQSGMANRSAMSQVGKENHGVIVQDGDGHFASAAQLGERNSVVALQTGDGGANDNDQGNIAAHGQVGNDNVSVSYQDQKDNVLASLQEGDRNESFINQGGGVVEGSLTDIASDSHSADLPSGASLSGSGVGSTSNRNAAASLQFGDDNSSAIGQWGEENSAVNYQNNS